MKPRSTAFYDRHKADPTFKRARRQYARLYREQHADPGSPTAIFDRVKQAGCAVCGERADECLDLYPFGSRKPVTVRASVVKRFDPDGLRAFLAETICLCANCARKHRYGRIGLPHWVPEEYRWI